MQRHPLCPQFAKPMTDHDIEIATALKLRKKVGIEIRQRKEETYSLSYGLHHDVTPPSHEIRAQDQRIGQPWQRARLPPQTLSIHRLTLQDAIIP